MPSASSSAGNPPGQGKKPRGRGLSCLTVGLVLVGVAGYVAYQIQHRGGPPSAGCTVRAEGRKLDLTAAQAGNAATIVAVATARSLPERAMTIALATALQESRLENLNSGDLDSLGLFQQRPSQGWGTERQILDPVYATNVFYDSLVKIDGYTRLPLTVAAQKVQKSGYPQAYAKQEADATLLSVALAGHDASALSCTTGAATADSAGGPAGRTATVTARLTREFGAQVKPRPDDRLPRTVAVPATVPAGKGSGGAPADRIRRGWEVALWAVAHARDLKVEEVSFGGAHWLAAQSAKGWQNAPRDQRVSATVRAASDGLVRITVAG